jgi:transposase
MFLRKKRRRHGGEDYTYWSLCESVRTARGPRQRVVACLGKLDDAEVNGGGWNEIGALLADRAPEPRAGLRGERREPAARWEQVDVFGVQVERTREFGEVYLALALWRRLKLDELLASLLGAGRESVDWATVASVLVAARFCAQRSELGLAEHWYETTALEDLLGVPPALINDDRLYRALDELGAQKEALCTHLIERYQDWFGVRMEFLLYDVTSSFFEGQAMDNPLAQRGYSRDQRPDCKQVCIGLVCTPEGLPLAYEVFAGNRTDVTTVEEIVTMMEKKYGQAQRIWVMDRGMVSEANIAFLRERGARYIVGTPKSWLRHFEAKLLEKENWQEVQDGVEARLVDLPGGAGQEKYLLCRSTARANKERAMLERQSDRLTAELRRIDARLRRCPQSNLEAVGRSIGRVLGKYPAAAAILDATVVADERGHAVALTITSDIERGQQAALRKGAYLLRTNCEETNPALLWRWYIQLTQAEAAFRTAKTDLGLRPIYHHKAERVKAHILVCFLGLALWRCLEQWMAAKGLGTCARTLVKAIATIKSMDVIMPVRHNGERLSLRLRLVAKPETEVTQLLAHLGLQLPLRPKLIENVVPKTRV